MYLYYKEELYINHWSGQLFSQLWKQVRISFLWGAAQRLNCSLAFPVSFYFASDEIFLFFYGFLGFILKCLNAKFRTVPNDALYLNEMSKGVNVVLRYTVLRDGKVRKRLIFNGKVPNTGISTLMEKYKKIVTWCYAAVASLQTIDENVMRTWQASDTLYVIVILWVDFEYQLLSKLIYGLGSESRLPFHKWCQRVR